MRLISKRAISHHLIVGSLAATMVYFFYALRPEFLFNTRLWKALGDTAFIFLSITLMIGPLARLWKKTTKLVSWRREFGIWFAILAILHFLKLRIYLFAPGLELPTLLGIIALFFTTLLLATSSDMAVRFLGTYSWKWLHNSSYIIFYLVSSHIAFFLLFNKNENWFKFIFLIFAFLVPILQFSAFIKTVYNQRKSMQKTQTEKITENNVEKKSNSFKVLELPISKRRTIALNTNEVSFNLENQNFDFKAGQYVKIFTIKEIYSDEKGNSRLMSIASSPNNKKELKIAFRNSSSAFKKNLLELPIGSLVKMQGPYGFFTLPKDENQEIVFVAGGIGITPCLSMILFANEEKLKNKITLIYGNKDTDSDSYLEELELIEKENPNFKLENIYGMITKNLITEKIPEIKNKLWYVVGPPVMVDNIKNELLVMGIEKDKIKFENFTGL